MPFVYILRCRDGTLYTGATKDLKRRLKTHLLGRASRYTRARLPVEIVWSRAVGTWSRALREEIRLKKLSRLEKLAMIRHGEAPGGAARAARARDARGGR